MATSTKIDAQFRTLGGLRIRYAEGRFEGPICT
jgi:hypothetical protein